MHMIRWNNLFLNKDGGATIVSYIMTNGIYYIFVQGKSIKKVLDVAKATVFQNYDDAVGTISKHKGKCKSYRIYDVTDLASADFDEINRQKQ